MIFKQNYQISYLIKLIGKTNKLNNLKELRAVDSVTLLYSAEEIFGYVGYYPVIDNYSIFEPFINPMNKEIIIMWI